MTADTTLADMTPDRARQLIGRHLAAVDKLRAFLDSQHAPKKQTRHGTWTSAEQRVLPYLATELTGAEIAAALGRTEEAVKSHARRIYRKLGVTNRAGAIVALQRGQA